MLTRGRSVSAMPSRANVLAVNTQPGAQRAGDAFSRESPTFADRDRLSWASEDYDTLPYHDQVPVVLAPNAAPSQVVGGVEYDPPGSVSIERERSASMAQLSSHQSAKPTDQARRSVPTGGQSQPWATVQAAGGLRYAALIVGHDTVLEPSPHVKYVIHVRMWGGARAGIPGQEGTGDYAEFLVKRRYTTFNDLNSLLTKEFPSVQLPFLPQASWRRNFSSEYLLRMRTNLALYLRQLLGVRSGALVSCPPLIQFLTYHPYPVPGHMRQRRPVPRRHQRSSTMTPGAMAGLDLGVFGGTSKRALEGRKVSSNVSGASHSPTHKDGGGGSSSGDSDTESVDNMPNNITSMAGQLTASPSRAFHRLESNIRGDVDEAGGVHLARQMGLHSADVDGSAEAATGIRLSLQLDDRPLTKPGGSDSIALSRQGWTCPVCSVRLNLFLSGKDCHFCYYTGLFFCRTCHVEDTILLPYRMVRHWDFKPYRVSRHAKEYLESMWQHPVICLSAVAPQLFDQQRSLRHVRMLRVQLVHMHEFVSLCRQKRELTALIGEDYRFMEDTELYSLRDVEELNSGELQRRLVALVETLARHIIRHCMLCSAKGSVCELCEDTSPIYPFQLTTVVQCRPCGAFYHRRCFHPAACPRCLRLKQRRRQIAAAAAEERGEEGEEEGQGSSAHTSGYSTPEGDIYRPTLDFASGMAELEEEEEVQIHPLCCFCCVLPCSLSLFMHLLGGRCLVSFDTPRAIGHSSTTSSTK